MARKQHKYHYIYKTTCNVTGRYYIGMHSTDNLEDSYLGSGRRLWLSINKHGKENHVKQILEFLESSESLKLREGELVNETTLKDPLCMNLQIGGGGGFSDSEHQLKCSIAGSKVGPLVVKKLWAENKEWSDNKRKILSKRFDDPIYKKSVSTAAASAFLGKHHSAETKKIISDKLTIAQLGNKNSQFGTMWINNGLKNKKIKNTLAVPEGWVKGRISERAKKTMAERGCFESKSKADHLR